MYFKPELAFSGKRLLNHVIRIIEIMDLEICGSLCFTELNCASYNLKVSAGPNGHHQCELNNATHEGHENEMEKNSDYVYRGVKVVI